MSQNIFHVSNRTELNQALSQARGGDSILLAAGNYGDVRIGQTGVEVADFIPPVTIASADPADPAVLSGLDVYAVQGLILDGLQFKYDFSLAQSAVSTSPFTVRFSQDIAITNSVFQGDTASGTGTADDGYPTGVGLLVTDSSGITLTGNEVANFWKGVRISQSSDVEFSGNEIHDFRSDALNIVQVQRVLIEDNHLHDRIQASASGDHGDMIQLWTTGTRVASTDITIRGNLIDVGQGDKSQSIFLTNTEVDRDGAGDAMLLRNILVENNVIINAQKNAIVIGAGDGIIVRNNSVIHAAEADATNNTGLNTPSITLSGIARNVEISNNVAPQINGFAGQPDWKVTNNVIIQDTDPTAPNHYSVHFIDATGDIGGHLPDLQLRADSTILARGAGAPMLHYNPTPDVVTPIATAAVGDHRNTYILDASLSAGPAGQLTDQDATFMWDFGDGQTGQGRTLAHTYANAGNFAVTLQVVLSDGTVFLADTAAPVCGPELISFSSVTGELRAISYGNTRLIQATGPGTTLDLGTASEAQNISSATIAPLFGADSFEISMRMIADGDSSSSGELFRIQEVLLAQVGKNGELIFQLTNDSGTTKTLATAGAHLNDGGWHDLTIRYDGELGVLDAQVDGAILGSTSLTGTVNSALGRDFQLGGAYGRGGFDNQLSDFSLKVAPGDYQNVLSEVVFDTFEPPVPDPAAPAPAPALFDASLYALLFDLDPASTPPVLHNGAHLTETATGPALALDGSTGWAQLGSPASISGTDSLGFVIDFARETANGAREALFNNHRRLSVGLNGDGIEYLIGTADGGTYRGKVTGLGLDDSARHSLIGLLDAGSDEFQLILDDELIYQFSSGPDFDIQRLEEKSWDWQLGHAWADSLNGVIHDFRLYDLSTPSQPAPDLIV